MVPDRAPAELLSESPLFRSMEPAVQEHLARRARFRAFRESERILSAGDPGGALLVLLSGQAEVFAREGAARLRIAVVQPGDLMGEIAFFAPDLVRTADVVGREPGMVAEIGVELYQELARTRPHAAAAIEKAVLSVLADRLESTNGLIAPMMDRYRGDGAAGALTWLRGLMGAR